MELTRIGIDEILLAEYNPRKDLKPGDDEYEKIRASIEEFGYIDPIIANRRNANIIGGHQRWKVLKDLGYTEIDVIYVDVDEKTEKAMNLALNKISGEWDKIKLRELMIEFEEQDLIVTGFDEAEINEIINQFEIPEFTDPIEKDDSPKTMICPNCGEEIEI